MKRTQTLLQQQVPQMSSPVRASQDAAASSASPARAPGSAGALASSEPLGAAVDRARAVFEQFQRENAGLQARLTQAQQDKDRLRVSAQSIDVRVVACQRV